MICVLLLILSEGWGPPAQELGDPRAEAEKAIETLLGGSEWKAAVKAIQAYGRKYARTGEEKEKCLAWLGLASGSQALDKIVERYQKHQKADRTAVELYRFLEKHGGIRELRDRASEVLDAVRPVDRQMLEDFEDPLPDPTRGKVELVSDDVREGTRAGLWKSDDREGDYFYFYFLESDWTEWEHLCFWVRTEKAGGKISIMAMTTWNPSWPQQFCGFVDLRKPGWSLVRLPLHGRKTVFRRDGTADWSRIRTLSFKKEGIETQQPIRLDGIWLERDRKRSG